MLNSADWIGTAQIDFVESQIQITVALATACEECSTEWRLGIRAVDSEVSAPEFMLSHTMTEVWWDENINWQYPNHLGDSTPYTDQNWISHQGNIITYTIPLRHSSITLDWI